MTSNMMAESFEWVEMIAPQTRERMYANIMTGECVWQPPPGVNAKRAHANQWWELYDKNTDRYYYFNVARNQTIWHRPRDADIIPLTKLQALKEQSGEGVVEDEGMHTLTRQYNVEQRQVRSITNSATSPQLSTKRRYNARHSDNRSDRSTDVSSVGSASPVQLVGSSNDTYGYVHRGKPSMHVQRSLESHSCPRTCDILLDLERSSRLHTSDIGNGGGGGPRTPDLMSRSCHGQFQAINRGNLPAPFSAGPVESDWKAGVESPYSELSSVLAAQATPRPKPRAFPRTNPYVGVTRNDGFSTCQRGSESQFYQHQAAYDLYAGQPVVGVGIGPATAMNVEYSTLRSHRPATSQSLNIGESAYYATYGSSESPNHEVVMRSPQSRAAAQLAAGRRGSEPIYVNIPFAGLKGSSKDEGAGIEREWRVPDGSYTYDTISGKVLINENAEVFDDTVSIISEREAQYDKEMDQLSNLSLGSNVFINTATTEASSFPPKVQKPSPSQMKSSGMGPPDLLHRGDVVGQKLAEADRSESPVSMEKNRMMPTGRAVPCEIPTTMSNATFSTPALMRRYRTADGPAKLCSESDGDLYAQELQQGCGEMELGSLTEFDLELFAHTRLNEHRKGLLGRQLPVESLLTWSKDGIKKPIIRTPSKSVKKDAAEIFRRIQMYMGDRNSSGNRASSTSQVEIAMEVVSRGWSTVELRDEIYIQLCRQTTRNPHQESLQRGLELLCVCLAFFPPSASFMPYLQLHLNGPLDNTIASVKPVVDCVRQCQRRLERIVQTGAKKGLNKPSTDDIDYARWSIYAPSMFGCTLTELMAMQHDMFPTRRLPWIQTTLSEEILRLNGICTEGIFRVPGDIDAVNTLKLQCDAWSFTPSTCLDPCVPASLLKLWYRELYEPLVPFEFYDECIEKCNDVEGVLALVKRLPPINQDVLKYLIRFLQVFAAPENVATNKMDVNNLAMVMAPNCLRSRVMTPQAMLDNARHEMAFVRTLIQYLDTTDMDGVI